MDKHKCYIGQEVQLLRNYPFYHKDDVFICKKGTVVTITAMHDDACIVEQDYSYSYVEYDDMMPYYKSSKKPTRFSRGSMSIVH